MGLGRGLLLLFGLMAVLGPRGSPAQPLLDQEEIDTLLSRNTGALNALPDVHYDYYIFGAEHSNTVAARNRLYRHLGDGDVITGRRRGRAVALLNRTTTEHLSIGDTLAVPTRFGLDFRAYSPFPRYYTGSHEHEKLLVLNKEMQGWAAYEYGRLKRWGIINSGALETPTPNGRFNVNWKEKKRLSSESPPGDEWWMYWVMNLHDGRGIHLHQYAMPTGRPTSHGCVRLVNSDAKWLYQWTDAWETTATKTGSASRYGRLLEPGTTVLVVGEEPTGAPKLFRYERRYPILRRVRLPADPCDVPPGSPQQERRTCQQSSPS
ncbi:MAG: L,D-transpeptidase [Salinibacter sp.]